VTTEVKEKTIKLIDGTEVAVRPLKISLLRKFMKKFEGVGAVAEDNDKSMNLLIECVQIAMQQYMPEIAGDAKALEDNIDLPTVYQIIEEASGVKLSDQSLINM
jgi:inhibitor of KinA sporulation pathway (predicted exonuclease)